MPGGAQGKVAIVTGGASGMGRATSLLFGREGAKVVVADYNREGGEATAKAIRQAGGESIFHNADVSEEADVEALVNKTIETYGRLDWAFNNAGIDGGFKLLHEMSLENWNRVIAVDLTSVFLCIKYEIPQMIKSGAGSIVNTSSVAGLRGNPLIPAYVAAKHGVIGVTRAAASAYAKHKIRINAICPGPILTAMMESALDRGDFTEEWIMRVTPLKRFGQPEEIANTVMWLCSDKSSYVTGVALPVDGAMTAAES